MSKKFSNPILKAGIVAFLSLPVPATAAVKIVNVDSCLRIRNGSAKYTRAFDCIDRGAVVETTGRKRNNWIQVIHEGRTGWVSANFTRRTASRPSENVRERSRVRDPEDDRNENYEANNRPSRTKPAETGEPKVVTVEPQTGPHYVDSGKISDYVMKRDKVARSGQCLLPVVKTAAQADEILRNYALRAPAAKPEERLAMAKVLFQMTALNGGVFRPLTDTSMSFNSRDGVSRQSGNHLTMARGAHNCNSPHFGHEQAHILGHRHFRNGQNFYDAFSSYMGRSRCVLRRTDAPHKSTYTAYSRNENYAEMFSAYLTRPELLSQGNASCQKAYAFFAEEVFKESGHLASCDPRKKDMLMAELAQRNAASTHGIVVQYAGRTTAPAGKDQERFRSAALK